MTRTHMAHLSATGLSLGAMTRAAMATTSITTHEARLQVGTYSDPRMHMTIDELRALPGGTTGATAEPDYRSTAVAKRARRAARGDVSVVINRRPVAPTKPKRKSRAKKTAA